MPIERIEKDGKRTTIQGPTVPAEVLHRMPAAVQQRGARRSLLRRHPHHQAGQRARAAGSRSGQGAERSAAQGGGRAGAGPAAQAAAAQTAPARAGADTDARTGQTQTRQRR
jgi:hypothetical protein